MIKIFDTIIPITTKSEANLSEHWSAKHKRHKMQKNAVTLSLNPSKKYFSPPCHIILTRYGRKLDEDNLIGGAFKHIRDSIGAIILNDPVPGHADSSPLLSWDYKQEKRLVPKQDAIRIEIFNKDQK